jgi:two-component system CheB/CheR fusion protein
LLYINAEFIGIVILISLLIIGWNLLEGALVWEAQMAEKKKASPQKKNRNRGKEVKPVKNKIAASAAALSGHRASLGKLSNGSFPIVGIGASAGGLEAIEQFVRHMRPDAGIAFIVIPHLDPSHASMMTDLIRRFTKMAVVEAGDGMQVEPDHVYVIPPNRNMAIFHKTIHLSMPGDPRGLRMPIDFFFRSLAEDQGERAICIVLSGTGSDGTLGLRAVNGAGGMSMVQDPASAKYDGMPESAIKTGLADYILPAEKMPEHLIGYVARFYQKGGRPTPLPEKTPGSIQKIFMLLRSKTGHDFSLYKKNTIHRRIEKRMSVHQLEDTSKYVRYLQEYPDEVKILFKELLIGVTNFFRDAEAFEILKKKILPKMLSGKPENYELRIWTPGCATAEEAYSIAMVIREYMDELKHNFKVQIFGTDIDEEAVAKARAGLYTGNISLDVNPQRLKRFFIKEGNDYRIKKDIREDVVFAIQNVIKDPPFTRLDLISCRNLMIYLEPELQNKLIPLFHYSLKPGGVLFLGPSESIGGFSDLFPVIDKKWKFYQRKESKLAIDAFTFPSFPGAYEREGADKPGEVRRIGGAGIPAIAQRILLANFAPPSVIVNMKGDILYIHGQTGKYLEPPPGQPTVNVLEMARKGLRLELRSALQNAVSNDREVALRDLRVITESGIQPVNLTVKPIREVEQGEGLFLVTFDDAPPVKKALPDRKKGRSARENKHVTELEQDLRYTRESLQATIEELQASNEELKSTNEEMQSTNEELQSTNEEMETSKEELQSVNEELITVNAELQMKIEQLSRAEGDMKNLLDSINVGSVFLDREMNIKRFTTDITSVINLIASDIGRPLGHIVTNLEDVDLVADAEKALETLRWSEKEVQSRDGKYYLMRTIPYRSMENVIDGVVITFTEITLLRKQAEELSKLAATEAALSYAEAIVATVREPLVVLDAELHVVSANRAFYKYFRAAAGKVEGRLLYELGNRQWDIPVLRELLEGVLARDEIFDNFEVEVDFEKIGRKRILLNARKISHEGIPRPLILLAMEVMK